MKILLALFLIASSHAATIQFADFWGPATGTLDVQFPQTIMGFNFFWQDPGVPDTLTVRINGTDIPASGGEFRWGAINGPLDSFRLTITGDGAELRGGHIWHVVEKPPCVADCGEMVVPEPGPGTMFLLGLLFGVITYILTRKPK